MIGFLLLYFVGKAFYTLAETHNKSKWGFAILGVASYYIGIILGGVILGLMMELGLADGLRDLPDMTIGLIAIPLGVLCCWGLYRILKSQWSKQPVKRDSGDILDAEVIE